MPAPSLKYAEMLSIILYLIIRFLKHSTGSMVTTWVVLCHLQLMWPLCWPRLMLAYSFKGITLLHIFHTFISYLVAFTCHDLNGRYSQFFPPYSYMDQDRFSLKSMCLGSGRFAYHSISRYPGIGPHRIWLEPPQFRVLVFYANDIF